MTFLPIVGRELRVASRKRATYLGRIGAAIVPVLIAGVWLPVLATQFTVSQGKGLYSVLSMLAFGYCLVAGALLTSDCLSSEKREGTIGLLFLTDLRGYDVILGKLVSRSLSAFYGLLATLPVMALALLLGGVTGVEIGRTALLLLNTLFFSMAAGVFVSAMSRHDRRALFATICVMLIVLFVPYAIALLDAWWGWKMSGRAPRGWADLASVVQVSPMYAFWILRGNWISPSAVRDFYASLGTTHLLGWVLLAVASVLAPKVCRERPPGRVGTRWLVFRNRWTYGQPARRAAFRARLLDRNAFYWLASRDRVKGRYVWFFIGALVALWAWSGWMYEQFAFDWDISVILLWFCFVFLKVWLASEVCTRLVEDRSSGAFELLLSTPVTIRDLAHGQSLALRRQFGRPVLALIGLAILLLFAALRSPHYGHSDGEIKLLFWTLVITLLADMAALKWVGMWNAVKTNQVNRAALGACVRILFLPSVAFVVLFSIYVFTAQAARGFNPASEGWWLQACFFWLLVSLTADFFFGLRARWHFLHHFRDVAAQRFSGPAPALEPFAELAREVRKRIFGTYARPVSVAARRPLWRRWWIAGPALILVCGILAFCFWKRAVHWRVDAALADIRARGEPTTVSALRNWTPVVLPQENAGELFSQAAIQLSIAAGQVARIRASKELDWGAVNEPLTPATRDRISKAVAFNRRALDLLHDGAKRPKSRYPVQWQFLPASVAQWQALSQVGGTAPILEYEALLAIEDGDRAGVLRTLSTLLALARAMDLEPTLAAPAQRIKFLEAALRTVERGLNRFPWPDGDLAFLQNSLETAEFATGPGLKRAFVGERCLNIEALASGQQNVGWGAGAGLSGWEKFLLDVARFAANSIELPNRSLLTDLSVFDETLRRAEAIRTLDPTLLHHENTTPGYMNPQPQDRGRALRDYHDGVLRQQLVLVTRLRVAQAALAVERFRIAHQGKLPKTEELTPTVLREWPADPFGGGPLQLKRLDAGFLVYSFGPDGRDNGGPAPQPKDPKAPPERDITFRVLR